MGGSGSESAPAADAYDRVCDRAWALASWLVGDEERAADAVAAAFFACASRPRWDWQDDARILCEVRDQALSRVVTRSPLATEIAGLPAPARCAVELAVAGRLTPVEIASVTGSTPDAVRALLASAMRQLTSSGRARGEQLQV